MNKPKLLVVNDNRLSVKSEQIGFYSSKFHVFLRKFDRFNITLSSPLLMNDHSFTNLRIDSIDVVIRPGFVDTSSFYRAFPVHILKQGRALWKHINRADIVVLVLPTCTVPISYTIAKLLGKPIVLYVVGDVFQVISEKESNSKLKNRFALIAAKWEQWFLFKIAAKTPIIVLGESMKKKISIRAPHVITAMTSLVELSDVSSPDSSPLRTPIQFLSVCRLTGEKGIETALAALSLIQKFENEFHYTIIGDGSERNKLEKIIKKENLQKHVTLMGWLEHSLVLEQYRKAHIFLIPSLSEGIPKVILDAMAIGVSVIGSNVGGIPDLIGEQEQRGWLVPRKDSKSLAQAIKSCLIDDVTRVKKLREAHEYIKKHTSEAEAEKIQELLMKTLHKKKI